MLIELQYSRFFGDDIILLSFTHLIENLCLFVWRLYFYWDTASEVPITKNIFDVFGKKLFRNIFWNEEVLSKHHPINKADSLEHLMFIEINNLFILLLSFRLINFNGALLCIFNHLFSVIHIDYFAAISFSNIHLSSHIIILIIE